MKKFLLLFTLLSSFVFSKEISVLNNIKNDYKNYYINSDYSQVSSVFLIGAILANSSIDENIKNYYQDNIRSSQTDSISSIAKQFGEGSYLIPISLIAASSNIIKENPVGQWGSIVSRSYLVGFPSLLFLQRATGASRPDSFEDASHWNFFNRENGVSGHAFIGSIPFLAASHLTQNKVLSNTLVGLSTLTAISRVNDNKHFTSQAILGWYLGYLSINSIIKTNEERQTPLVLPYYDESSTGLTITGTF